MHHYNSIRIDYLVYFICAVIITLYCFIKDEIDSFSRNKLRQELFVQREVLIQLKKQFIISYTDIMQHAISNEFVSAKIKSEKIIIENNLKFVKISAKSNDINEIWNCILENFSEYTTYDEILNKITYEYGFIDTVRFHSEQKSDLTPTEIKKAPDKKNNNEVKPVKTDSAAHKLKTKNKERNIDI